MKIDIVGEQVDVIVQQSLREALQDMKEDAKSSRYEEDRELAAELIPALKIVMEYFGA